MGEIYRARDTKLKRDVALKVLPEAFARDPDRMARFQHEAELLASLNHPNIAHIYGVEDRAIVMELVEGRTLQGPIPVETALHYAKQIAGALECTHERDVIHRDLKPANIKVTPEGVMKILDFGLPAMVDDEIDDLLRRQTGVHAEVGQRNVVPALRLVLEIVPLPEPGIPKAHVARPRAGRG
jgi:serine/threonine-protein kinase